MKTEQKHTSNTRQHSQKRQPFFREEGQGSFFSENHLDIQPFFSPEGSGFIQPKLTIGKPGDRYEQEADAMADAVIKGDTPASPSHHAEGNPQTKPLIQRMENRGDVSEPILTKLQRKEAPAKDEEEVSTKLDIQTKLENTAPETDILSSTSTTPGTTNTPTLQKQEETEQEEETATEEVQPMLQMAAAPPGDEDPNVQTQGEGTETAGSDIESSLSSSKGGGSSLSPETQSEMGSAFGADFSGVRVHTDDSAVQMNQKLGAQAFTHGNDIYFNQGKYDPNSSSGKHLLAHELTHTVQQGAAIQTKPKISTNNAPRIQLLPMFIKKGINWVLDRVVPGYTLLNVFLGKNIITDEHVPRTGVNIIKGYMRLSPVIGSILLSELEETDSLKEAGKWVEGKVKEIGINFDDISRRMRLTWDEFSVWKGIDGNAQVFKKYMGPVVGKIRAFSSVVMERCKILRLEGALLFVGAQDLLAGLKKDPKAMKRAAENPGQVLKSFMVNALKKGFGRFKDNFGTHFKNALLGWLFGKAAEMGVTMPKQFNIAGLFSLIAQLVGATYTQIRALVVKKLGPKGEMIVSKLEATVTFVKDLITRGPIVLWEKVKDFLSNLKEMFFSKITELVLGEVVKAAVTKLLSMLNPAGAIVQLALTLYRVIKFFIDNWQTIKDIATGILNSIGMVALGKIGPAAEFVEKVLAKGMQLVIAFLAKIFGLGGIVKKVQGLIKKISAPVKKAIGKVVGWLVKMGKKLFKKLTGKGKKGKKLSPQEKKRQEKQGLHAIDKKENKYLKNGKIKREDAQKVANSVRKKYPAFQTIRVMDAGERWDYDYTIQPKLKIGERKYSLAGIELTGTEILTIIREVAEDIMRDDEVKKAKRKFQRQNKLKKKVHSGADYLGAASSIRSGKEIRETRSLPGKGELRILDQNVKIGEAGTSVKQRQQLGNLTQPHRTLVKPGETYPEMVSSLRNQKGKEKVGTFDRKVATGIKSLVSKGQLPEDIQENPALSKEVSKMAWTMFGVETSRNPSNLVTSKMTMDMIESGEMTMKDALDQKNKSGGALPMSMVGAKDASRLVEKDIARHRGQKPSYGFLPETKESAKVKPESVRKAPEELAKREINIVVKWAKNRFTEQWIKEKFKNLKSKKAKVNKIKAEIKKEMKSFYLKKGK